MSAGIETVPTTKSCNPIGWEPCFQSMHPNQDTYVLHTYNHGTLAPSAISQVIHNHKGGRLLEAALEFTDQINKAGLPPFTSGHTCAMKYVVK